MRCEQIVPVVDLVDVNLAKLLHVLEHLVGESHAFARIIKGFRMILILTEDGAELQLEFAFVIHATVALRDFLALVEFRLTDQGYTLL